MPFDSVTFSAVTEDLRAHLLGGRVDKVVQPAALDVAFLLRAHAANHWLMLSAHAQMAHVQRTMQKQSGAFNEPSAFVMLLRKYLEGARLQEVTQQGVDRVLRLLFHGALGELVLIAEVMGKYSNIILADRDLTVLGAVKHIHSDENRVRVILPHHPYLPPPRPLQPPPHHQRPKFDPLASPAGDLAAALAHGDPAATLWKALLDIVDGLSPCVAREVVYRVTGSTATLTAGHTDLESAAHFLSIVRRLYSAERGQPSAHWGEAKLLEWAAFPLHQFGVSPRLYPDVSALLDVVYTARTVDPLAGQRGPLVQAIDVQLQSLQRKIVALESALIGREVLDTMRTQGEMVLAYQHSIEPGQRMLAVPELGLSIPLDPSLSALDNAQRLFKRYHKARDASTVVPALLDATQQDRAYLEQLAVHAAQASDQAALAAVRDELRETMSTGTAPAKTKAKRQERRGAGGKGGKVRPSVAPLRIHAADGTEIVIGRSARQNEAVTFQVADQRDLWLHARQIPGAHVIIRTGGRPPSHETLVRAAGLAAYYSKGRESTAVPVDYTAVRNVRRIKGGKPGLVHYSGEATINVRPAG